MALVRLKGYSELRVREVQVPPNKVDRVRKVVAAVIGVARTPLIPAPGAVKRLWVTVGAAGSRPREQPEQMTVMRSSVSAKAGFMSYDREGQLNRRAPIALSLEQALRPHRVMAHDRARLVRVMRPRGLLDLLSAFLT